MTKDNQLKFFALVCTIIATLIGAGCAKEEELVNPSREFVKMSINGMNLDIPLGYFFHKTIWNSGRWPKPNSQRTPADSVRIYAHIDGISPWRPEISGAFQTLAGPDITMIVIHGRYSPEWLSNSLAPRLATLRSVKVHDSADGLLAFESDYASNETIFLQRLPPEKPFMRITCGKSPGNGCEVMFDYKDHFVVSYQLSRGRIHNWKSIHTEMLRILDTF